MDKQMHLSKELGMANRCTNKKSHGEQFTCGDANSSLVLKFELDKYWTFPSEPTIPLQEVRSTDKESSRDPLDNLEAYCSQNVVPLLEHSENANVPLVEMPMADLSLSVTCSSVAHSSGETVEMRDHAAPFSTTLVNGDGKETIKVPVPLSTKGYLCTICNKTFSSNQGLGSHMSVLHKKKKKSPLGDGSGSSSVGGEQSTLKFVCRKCKERFPTRKLLGGHIRKHWREAFKRTSPPRRKNRKPRMPTSSARWKNRKPPIPLARESLESSEPEVSLTDKGKQPPVLLCSDNMQPTRMEQAVANATLHQPLPLDFEETEPSSCTIPNNLINTRAALHAPKQIPPAERCVLDLNMLPPDETDEWEP